MALSYAAFAAAWGAYSDRSSIWLLDPDLLTRAQTWKGVAFVLFTALVRWWVARAGFARQGSTRQSVSRREDDRRALFHAHPLPMWVCERVSGRKPAARDAAVRHYGYTRPEFIALTLADFERAPAGAAECAGGRRRTRAAG